MVGVEAKENLPIFESEAGNLGVNLQDGEVGSLGVVIAIAIIIILIIGIRRLLTGLGFLTLRQSYNVAYRDASRAEGQKVYVPSNGRIDMKLMIHAFARATSLTSTWEAAPTLGRVSRQGGIRVSPDP